MQLLTADCRRLLQQADGLLGAATDFPITGIPWLYRGPPEAVRCLACC